MDLNLRAVLFTDTKRGTAVGLRGLVVTTINGGETWEVAKLYQSACYSLWRVAQLSPDTAYVVGNAGHIVRTNDFGRSWIDQHGLEFDLLMSYAPTANRYALR